MASKKILLLAVLGSSLLASSAANAFFCFNFFFGGDNNSRVKARIETVGSPDSRIHLRSRGFQRPIVETRYLRRDDYPPIMPPARMGNRPFPPARPAPPLVRNRIYLTN